MRIATKATNILVLEGHQYFQLVVKITGNTLQNPTVVRSMAHITGIVVKQESCYSKFMILLILQNHLHGFQSLNILYSWEHCLCYMPGTDKCINKDGFPHIKTLLKI